MKKSSLKALLAGTVAAGLMSTTAFAADLDVEPAKEYVEVGSFKGSILLPGTGISFKVGGYTKGDVIFTFDDFNNGGGQGVFELLNTGTGGGLGGDRVRFHALQSRVNFDARTTTDLGSARAFLEVDLFNTAGNEGFSNSANPRLRHAFAELGLDNLGGSLLIGQTWTNFGDLNSYANTLDFNGPNAQVFIRQAQVRWTQPITDSVTFSISAENPEFLGAASGPDNGLDQVPDFTAVIKGSHGLLAGGTFHLGGIVRFLNVDNTANPGTAAGPGLFALNPETGVIEQGDPVAATTFSTDTAVGYAFTFGATVGLTESTKLGFQANYGDGNGRYIQFGGPAAVASAVDGDLDTLRQAGVLGWIQHKWSPKLQSNAVFGHYSNLEGSFTSDGTATGNDVRSQQYAAINLIYSPRGNINLGVEGSYVNDDFVGGGSEDLFRLQTSLQFSF